MTMTKGNNEKGKCEECKNFRFHLRQQLDAFRILSSVSNGLSASLLLENLNELLRKADEECLKEVKDVDNKGQVEEKVIAETPAILDIVVEPSKDQEENSVKEENKEDDTEKPLSWTRRRRKGWKLWEKKCRNILNSLWSHEDSEPFRRPVNVHQCPDYNIVIDRPMCLEMVKDSLERIKYKNPTEFDNDILQIFKNSQKYNVNQRSKIRRMTSSLEGFYKSNSEREELLIDWKSRSSRSRKPFQPSNNNTKQPVKKEKEEIKVKEEDSPVKTRFRHMNSKNRTEIPCRKCSKKFLSYSLLNIHSLKCNGKMESGTVTVVKKRGHPPAILVAQNMTRKLKAKENLKKIQKGQMKKTTKKKDEIKRRGRKKKNSLECDTKGLIVRNPFPGFNLKRTVGVRVRLEPLRLRMSYFQPQHFTTTTSQHIFTTSPMEAKLEQSQTLVQYEDDDDDETMAETGDASLPALEEEVTSFSTVPEPDFKIDNQNMSAMILHKLESLHHNYDESPMKMTQIELNWTDIESREFEDELYPLPLLPIQTEWDPDFDPTGSSSSLIPLTTISMTNGYGISEFYPNSYV